MTVLLVPADRSSNQSHSVDILLNAAPALSTAVTAHPPGRSSSNEGAETVCAATVITTVTVKVLPASTARSEMSLVAVTSPAAAATAAGIVSNSTITIITRRLIPLLLLILLPPGYHL